MGKNNKLLFSLQDKLEVVNNSELEEIKFKDDYGNPVVYSIDTIFKIGGSFSMGVISNEDYKGLVDVESLRKMIKHGYISNAIVNSHNVIQSHSNKIKNTHGLKPFKIENIDTLYVEGFEQTISKLEEEFAFVISIDNNLDNIGIQRLNIVGAVFDLSDNVAAIEVKNDFVHKYIDIKTYRTMCSKEYNQGNYSTHSIANNFCVALSYVLISPEKYDKLKKKLGKDAVRFFHQQENSTSYKEYVWYLKPEVARLLFGAKHVHYAVPKPDKIRNLSYFKSALSYSAHIPSTYFNTNDYIVISGDVKNLHTIKGILINNFDYLRTGTYLKDYADLKGYIIDELRKLKSTVSSRSDSSEDIVVTKLLEICKLASNGVDISPMFNSLNFRVLNTDNTLDEDELNNLTAKVMHGDLSIEEFEKYFRPATLKEALEMFNLEHLYCEPTTFTKIQEKVEENDSASDIIEVAYLNNDCSARLEILRNNNDVYARLVNDKTQDKIIIKKSVISYPDYINDGLDKELVIDSLKRFLSCIQDANNLSDIVTELRLS